MDFGNGPRGGREEAGRGGERGGGTSRARREGEECDFTAAQGRSTSSRNVEVGRCIKISGHECRSPFPHLHM